MNTKLTFLGLLSLTFLAGSVISSPGEYEQYYLQRGPMPFEALDRNGDGIVTAEEHATVREERQTARAKAGYMMRNAGKPSSFEKADIDGSGAISRKEFSNWQNMRFQQRW
jgi:hypothetical protein